MVYLKWRNSYLNFKMLIKTTYALILAIVLNFFLMIRGSDNFNLDISSLFLTFKGWRCRVYRYPRRGNYNVRYIP